LLFLALVIPAAYYLSLGGDSDDKSENPFLPASASFSENRTDALGLTFISRGTSIFLLVVYVIYLIFQVIPDKNITYSQKSHVLT